MKEIIMGIKNSNNAKEKEKFVIARDFVCLRDKKSWYGSWWKVRLLYYKKKKGKDKKRRILMLTRNCEYTNYFKNWFLSKNFKPAMLNIISCENRCEDVKI